MVLRRLEDNVRTFCSIRPSDDLAELIQPALNSEKLIFVYDPYSEAYAEIASWPLIMFGLNVSVVSSHEALYYYAPYTKEGTSYIYFTDNLEGQLGVQLESALRVMGYNRYILSWFDAKTDEVITFSSGSDGKSVLKGVKNLAYSFTKALYKINSNQRLARVLNNLLVDQTELFEYINRSTSYTESGVANTVASQGPLLSVAKIVALLNPQINVIPLTRLLTNPSIENVEVWGLDVDSELIARIRFERGGLNHVVHFGLDPLSSTLVSVYAVTYAEIFGTKFQGNTFDNQQN
ncbi:MAG: hypothetical protein QW514_04335 [Thermoprotei archaeon]